MSSRCVWLLLLFLLAPASPALADTWRLDFSGAVKTVTGTPSERVSAGDPVSGSIVYQNGLKVGNRHPESIVSVSAQLGDYAFSDDPAAGTVASRYMQIDDDYTFGGQTSPRDRIFWHADPIGDSLGGRAPISFQLAMSTLPADALDDEFIPTAVEMNSFQAYAPFGLYDSFTVLSFERTVLPGGGWTLNRIDFRVDAFTVTDLTPVPEPTSAWLVGLGALLAARCGRRR